MKNRNILISALSFLRSIACYTLFAFLFVAFFFRPMQISGTSMTPTLHDDDKVLINVFHNLISEPQRFDVVVARHDDELWIKRVIGLPGETIQIKDGQILIDGETYQEDGGFPAIENAGVAETRVTLGNGEYFVLGDNRNNSEDSRYADMGNVKKRNIIGKVWFIASPWSRFGFV